MLSVDEAHNRIVAQLRPTQAEIVALCDACGRVTAAPIIARRTQPPADVSAMDGYALRAADAQTGDVQTGDVQTGTQLAVIGEAAAGHPFGGSIAAKQAVRVFTGSVLPRGADSVVMQEHVVAANGSIMVRHRVEPGQHIRKFGQDFSQGDTVIGTAHRLHARDIGLVASANHAWVTVHRVPRVAILATGDELSLPGDPVCEGGIVSSNAHSLAALTRAGGGAPLLLPIARDDPAAIAAAAERLGGFDLLVTTGGASVGDYDLVQRGLCDRGFELEFWTVALRPGKPLMYGKIGETPVLGLPGNPVSAFVCAVLFLLPALARLSGLPGESPRLSQALLGCDLRANDHRADYLRATLSSDASGQLIATPFSRQDSSMVRILAGADALVLRQPHAKAAVVREPVSILRLDTLGV